MARILIFGSIPSECDAVSSCLSTEHSFQNVVEVEAALHRARAWKPSLLILNQEMQDAQKKDFINKLRTFSSDEYICILEACNHFPVLDCKSGGYPWSFSDDFIKKPIIPDELKIRVSLLLRAKETQEVLRRNYARIEELDSKDQLTGVLNMKAAFKRGEEELTKAKRFKKAISALLMNLDGFSGVNQNHGFQVGSQILQETAKRMKECLSSEDILARVGADEFFVILKNKDLEEAIKCGERIKKSINANPFKDEKQSIWLTASIGLAAAKKDSIDCLPQKMGELLKLTSQALRSAKAIGADVLEIHSFSAST